MRRFANFGTKFLLNSAEILSKFCRHLFKPKVNSILKKRVLIFKFNAFCLDNLRQHCIYRKWCEFRIASYSNTFLANFCAIVGPSKNS